MERERITYGYELMPSALSSWIQKYNVTGSFKAEDNLSEKELIKLRKKVQRLKMENDISKQVALIMRRK